MIEDLLRVLQPDFEGRCPCGAKFHIDTKRYCVIHEMPLCPQFEKLDPEKYLHWVRVTQTGITDN